MTYNQISVYEMSEVYVKSLDRLLEQILDEPNIDPIFRERALKLQGELENFLQTIDHQQF
jgi:hypothetical protein